MASTETPWRLHGALGDGLSVRDLYATFVSGFGPLREVAPRMVPVVRGAWTMSRGCKRSGASAFRWSEPRAPAPACAPIRTLSTLPETRPPC